MEAIGNSPISIWHTGKSVFITGGTGFMGKVIIEKYLRACPVNKIYMLVRPKRNVEIEQRVRDTLSHKLFNKLRENNPEVLNKVVGVRGDITEERLGLSDSDEQMLIDECEIVVNLAATINFQEPMRVAVSMNMLGTKRVLALAKKMPKIQALVHVSTAYGNCHLQETYEELYPAPISPDKLMNMTDWLSDDVLDSMTQKLVHPRPNTYTYTKALAEHILVNEAEHVPYAIIRPSIVCGAWREPEPGWVDNLFAFTGLLVGMGKGVLRSLYIKQGIKLDFIPVDVAINLIIASAYNIANKHYKPETGHQIYCCSTGYQKPLTIEGLNEHLKETIRQIPQEHPIWFPDGSAKTNKTLHTIHVYVANVIPAYLADFFMKLFGKKEIAVKQCKRMIKAINALEYFMLRDWTFHNENVQGLWASLSHADRQLFHFNVGDLDWSRYIDRYQYGVKKFILKEGTTPADIERCHRNMNRMWWINRIVQLFMLFAAWLLCTSDISMTCLSTVFNEFVKMVSLTPVLSDVESSTDTSQSILME